MTPEQLDQLIARYVGGEATPDEAESLEARMAEDDALAKQVDAMRRAWQAAGSARSPWDSTAAWKAVKPRLMPQTSDESGRERLSLVRGHGQPAGGERQRSTAWLLARVAAVLLIVVGGGYGLTEWMSHVSAPEPLHQVATHRAELGNVYLSDGTRVQLGVETTLQFSPSLGRGSRDVYLEGNAYFEVARNPDRPFRVHTAHGVTEVLGTSFSVRAYAADSATTVVVAEGRVRLEQASVDADARGRAPAARSAVVLDPGDLGRASAEGEIEKQRNVAIGQYLAWRDRRLVFTDTPLKDVAVELARWYDVEVAITDPSLERRRLSATFGHFPLDQVLEHLELALDIRIEHDGRTVTLRSQ